MTSAVTLDAIIQIIAEADAQPVAFVIDTRAIACFLDYLIDPRTKILESEKSKAWEFVIDYMKPLQTKNFGAESLMNHIINKIKKIPAQYRTELMSIAIKFGIDNNNDNILRYIPENLNACPKDDRGPLLLSIIEFSPIDSFAFQKAIEIIPDCAARDQLNVMKTALEKAKANEETMRSLFDQMGKSAPENLFLTIKTMLEISEYHEEAQSFAIFRLDSLNKQDRFIILKDIASRQNPDTADVHHLFSLIYAIHHFPADDQVAAVELVLETNKKAYPDASAEQREWVISQLISGTRMFALENQLALIQFVLTLAADNTATLGALTLEAKELPIEGQSNIFGAALEQCHDPAAQKILQEHIIFLKNAKPKPDFSRLFTPYP